MSFEIWRWKTVASSLNLSLNHSLGFPGGATGKESACQCRRCKRFGFDPWVGKIPWNRKWQTHSSILAWSIPWAEKPGRVQSMGSQRVSHDWAWVCVRVRARTHTHTHTHSLLFCGATQWRDTHGQGTNVPGQRSVRVWDLPRAA